MNIKDSYIHLGPGGTNEKALIKDVSISATLLTVTRAKIITTNGVESEETSTLTIPTWNQSTSGNAATATKLQTGRYLWGNLFDGSTNITGTIAATKIYLNGTPSEYSTESTYALNAYVTYQGKVYKCTTAITTKEAWTTGHWTEVSNYLYINGDIKTEKNIVTSSLSATRKMVLNAGKVYDNITGSNVLISVGSRLFSDALAITNPTTANDVGWIRCLGTGEADTVLEIATGDDGGTGESIVFRGYNTSSSIIYLANVPKVTNTLVAAGTPTAANYVLVANSTTAGDGKWIAQSSITAGAATYASNVGVAGTVGTNYVTAAKVISTCNWYDTMINTANDTDNYINRWKEVVDFLANFTESDDLASILSKYVTLDTTQTISGSKTFSNAISGDLLGNATTADRLKNSRTITIGSKSNTFDGSGDITFTLAQIGAQASGSYKTTQTAVTKSTSTTNNFLTSITQNTNGNITDATFTALDTSGTWSGKAATADRFIVANNTSYSIFTNWTGSYAYLIMSHTTNKPSTTTANSKPNYDNSAGYYKTAVAYADSAGTASSASAVDWSNVNNKPYFNHLYLKDKDGNLIDTFDSLSSTSDNVTIYGSDSITVAAHTNDNVQDGIQLTFNNSAGYITSSGKSATSGTADQAKKIYVYQYSGGSTSYPLLWCNTTGTTAGYTDAYKTGNNLYFDPNLCKLTSTGGFIGNSLDINGTGEIDSLTVGNLTVTGASTLTGSINAGAITATSYNELLLTKASTGFTIAGGTTSKTLTVNNSYTLADACARGVKDTNTSWTPTNSGTDLISEKGLYGAFLKAGVTNIIEKTSITKTLKSSSWTETGYTLYGEAQGSYMIQIVDTTTSAVFTGVFSIYHANSATSNDLDEIPLHMCASASNKTRIYAATQNGKLYVSSQDSTDTSHSLTIKYKKLI